MMNEKESFVKVTIFGQEYTVKAPAEQSYIKHIAEYVDSNMRQVQEGLATPQPTARVAILAAMNIADELFSSRKSKDRLASKVESRILTLVELVDEALE